MGEAIIVVGLGFGDEGKGSIVDYLVRKHEATMVVRYNGGAQAAHHVETPEGRRHTFAQFGAGTLVPGCRTHLSQHVLINPLNMLKELDHLKQLGETDALQRTTIDVRSVVITPWHVATNRAREMARGADRHGSCGQGVGEARADQLAGHPTIYARDLAAPRTLLGKLRQLQEAKLAVLNEIGTLRPETIDTLSDVGLCRFLVDRYRVIADRVFDEAYLDGYVHGRATVVFEGAQGVLLDEVYGFPPHNTWTDTTTDNALGLLEQHGHTGTVRRIGVTRAYATRHGAGPFPTENGILTEELQDRTNGWSPWQGELRVGHFDRALIDYAIEACPVDEIAVTCMDKFKRLPKDNWRHGVGYMLDGEERLLSVEDPAGVADVLQRGTPIVVAAGRTRVDYRQVFQRHNLPVSIWSYGPTAEDKLTR